MGEKKADEIAAIICGKCNALLVEKRKKFRYLKSEFFADVPCCPVCGKIYLSEELVTGRIANLEAALEEK